MSDLTMPTITPEQAERINAQMRQVREQMQRIGESMARAAGRTKMPRLNVRPPA